MSWFDDAFRDMAVPVLMDFLGSSEAIVYIAPNGDWHEVYGIVTNTGIDDEVDDKGRKRRSVREVVITTDPTSQWGGIKDPQTKAVVMLAGEEWAVESVESQSDSLVRLVVVQEAIKERTRQGFRRA